VTSKTEQRWSAVVRRDPRFDGRFYYAVLTTGVYCRPSCPARRPRPENVVFHDSPADAERQGYRACKRCRPNQRVDARTSLVTQVCRRIEASESPPTLTELGRFAGLSPSHLQRVFKSVTGVSPGDYARAGLGSKLSRALREETSVARAAYAAGIGSSSRLHAASGRLGMKPSGVRTGGAGLDIRIGFAKCSLGLVLVGETDRGVCAIVLGDDRAALEHELTRMFPRATFSPEATALTTHLAEVVSVVDEGRNLELPLDVQGTAFQERVWQALRRIPRGTTKSYAELAADIGAPTATRAVANACGQNRLAVLIPCHRVLHADGTISGYRWGPERKRVLLEREGVSPKKRRGQR
jgi:AraC family transcriptional regulator, regulatory protein of adaptative response / methylated-DNA-[protein]-cysteine methyltransferase